MKTQMPRKLQKLLRLGLWNALTFKLADPLYRLLSQAGVPTQGKTYFLRTPSCRWPLEIRANTSDKDVFGTIHVGEEYAALGDLKDVRLIVDCGANAGYSSAYFLSLYPAARLLAVEPDSRNFEMLRRNLQPCADQVSLHQAGLWSHPTGLIVCRGQFRDGREWATQVRECSEGETADVWATDIETLLRESGFEVIDLLKIDIERSEIAVFSRNCENWLKRVRNIVIELHDSECERTFFQALSSYSYELLHYEELTICKNLQPK